MRKIYAIILLFLAILLATSAKAYDFYADCATGQTLCYTITSDTLPYTVKVVRSIFSVSGDIEIPESVEKLINKKLNFINKTASTPFFSKN